MASNPKLRANIEAAVQLLAQSHVDAHDANDMTLLRRAATADCKRGLAPPSFLESMGKPADTQISHDEYEALFAEHLKAARLTKCHVVNLVIDVEATKAVARIRGHFESKQTGVVLSVDTVLFLDFVEDGSKISAINQFPDVLQVMKLKKMQDEVLEKED